MTTQENPVTQDQVLRDEIANKLHEEWCGCDSWDGVNCEDFHEAEFRDQADAVMSVLPAAQAPAASEQPETVPLSFLHRAGFDVCDSCGGTGGAPAACGDCGGHRIKPIEDDRPAANGDTIEQAARLYVEDIYGPNPTCPVDEELGWGRDLARKLAARGLLADGRDRARIEKAKTLANAFVDEHAISDPASAAVLEIIAALTATEEPAAASETAPTSEEQQ